MRFTPDRSELLALVSVWIISPIVAGLAWAIAPTAFENIGPLPPSALFGMKILMLNEYLVPSIAGTALLVAISRLVKCESTRAFLCHLLTFTAFVVTATAMISLACLVRK